MKINLVFFADQAKLAFFKKFLNIKEVDELRDAEEELSRIEGLWRQQVSLIENIFLKVFGERPEEKIKIYIFPKYFNLGATETRDQIILFGQPQRTKNFPLAVITHELGHIFLAKYFSGKPSVINEIICYMLEDCIYSVLDKKSLAEVWQEKELNHFHLEAIRVAIREIKDRGPIVGRDLNQIIFGFLEQLGKTIIDIKPENGLLNNIS